MAHELFHLVYHPNHIVTKHLQELSFLKTRESEFRIGVHLRSLFLNPSHSHFSLRGNSVPQSHLGACVINFKSNPAYAARSAGKTLVAYIAADEAGPLADLDKQLRGAGIEVRKYPGHPRHVLDLPQPAGDVRKAFGEWLRGGLKV